MVSLESWTGVRALLRPLSQSISKLMIFVIYIGYTTKQIDLCPYVLLGRLDFIGVNY